VLLSLFGSVAKKLESSLSGGAAKGDVEVAKGPIEPLWHVEGSQAEKMPVLKQQVSVCNHAVNLALF
jgi:hypothetical protein